ncbi:MAG: ArsR/SmtB family transcription factor [Arachnia sp.]
MMESFTAGNSADLLARIEALEGRLEEVERQAALRDEGLPVESFAPKQVSTDVDALWALEELKRRLPSPGGVLYTGAVDYGFNCQAQWQWSTARDDVLDVDRDVTAQSLAALAHPVRIGILTAVLRGVATVAALSEELQITASGQAYHHVHQLSAQGWLSTSRRGHYEVPVARVVPAMVILAAAGATP